MIPIPLALAGLGPRLLLVGGLVAAVFIAGWSVKGRFANAEIATLNANHQEAVREALKAERKHLEGVLAVERAIRDDAEGTANAERERAAAAEAIAADLAVSRDGLRSDLRRYAAARAGATGAAATAAIGAAASAAASLVPGDVRDDMLTEGADAVGILAPALDSANSKHAAIAALWEQARARLKRLGEQGRTVEP